MKLWPAFDVRPADPDLFLAFVDDYRPTAIEERDGALRVFFTTREDRDAARAALAQQVETVAIEVDDEDWARRSQQNLAPITVGRITIVSGHESLPNPESRLADSGATHVVIRPSMGFGTGHHATTRLCLAALQAIDLSDRFLLDVGTGSGVLALAARRLGASRARGIDSDADAIQAARENLALNPWARHVTFDVADLTVAELPRADIVTANLTGALLVRYAPLLIGAVRPSGRLILSGLLATERDEVGRAFEGTHLAWSAEEEGWVGLAVVKMKKV